MQLHADLYAWDTSAILDAITEFHLPRQSEFARKELSTTKEHVGYVLTADQCRALYLQILELLGKGKAWEAAIALCKELQIQYEEHIFSYQRLAEVLAHQATLYEQIGKETRHFAGYFRVG